MVARRARRHQSLLPGQRLLLSRTPPPPPSPPPLPTEQAATGPPSKMRRRGVSCLTALIKTATGPWRGMRWRRCWLRPTRLPSSSPRFTKPSGFRRRACVRMARTRTSRRCGVRWTWMATSPSTSTSSAATSEPSMEAMTPPPPPPPLPETPPPPPEASATWLERWPRGVSCLTTLIKTATGPWRGMRWQRCWLRMTRLPSSSPISTRPSPCLKRGPGSTEATKASTLFGTKSTWTATSPSISTSSAATSEPSTRTSEGGARSLTASTRMATDPSKRARW
mmetsp:Transcript_70951/g.198974  ORF Transcript_70951/g.198974 Transcript_70951/m.198974 type:complete len:280 (-) Transcript_70951:677-1516(-)